MKWLVAIVSSIFLLPVLAADIYVERGHQVHIDGEIRTGDAERVASLISGWTCPASTDWSCPASTDCLEVLDLLGIFNQIDLMVAVN